MLEKMLAMTARFNQEIVGIEVPSRPIALPRDRVDARSDHFKEEDREFTDALTKEDQCDALIDGIYLRLGALVEMGILPGPVFEAVHEANMQKKRGGVNKRPKSKGFDAVKPEGWQAPDLTPFITITLADARKILLGNTDDEG